jgi:bile acid:Na+ symporter, BASS family
MQINTIINLLATGALFAMMVTVGLGVSIGDVFSIVKDWRLLFRAGVANYLIVPAVAVGLLMLVHPVPMVAAGFLIAIVCPGAPFGPPLTAMAKGKVVTAVGLMAVLAGSSAIIAPLLLRFLLPMVAGKGNLSVDSIKILTTLLLSQFLPLCLGLALRHATPGFAERLKKPATRVSTLLNLVLIALIFIVQFRLLQQIRVRGYLGMLVMVAATLIAGWLLSGDGKELRKTMAITTSTRNVGVALVIAAGSFPGTAAITAATAYALFQIFAVLLVAIAWGRMSSSAPAVRKAAA